MKKIIFIWVLSLIVLSLVSVNAQTVPKDTSQVAQDILKLKAQNDTLKMGFEKVKKEGYEKAIEGANRSISLSNLVIGIVALLVGLVAIFGFLRIRELKADYKETKAELKKGFEEDLERVKEYKKDIKEICEELKGSRQVAAQEVAEIKKFKEIMKEQQKDIPPDFSKDVSELAKKDSKTAIEDYERIMNRIFDEEIYRTMAYNYYLEKKYDESTLEIKKALKLNPDNFAAYYNWGVNLGKLGRYEESIEKYRKATEFNPDYGKAWYNIACAYSLQDKKKEALENLKKAIGLDPTYKEVVKKDEDFKNLWEDEDFKRLVE